MSGELIVPDAKLFVVGDSAPSPEDILFGMPVFNTDRTMVLQSFVESEKASLVATGPSAHTDSFVHLVGAGALFQSFERNHDITDVEEPEIHWGLDAPWASVWGGYTGTGSELYFTLRDKPTG